MHGSTVSHQPRPSIADRSPAGVTRDAAAERDADRGVAVRQDGLADMCGARAIATRIRSLIAQRDGGDVCAAARRLRVPVRQLVQLDTTLAFDAACDEARAAVETLLSAVVLRYQASAVWLLTGCHQPDLSALPPKVAEQLTSLCIAVAGRVIEEYQTSCLAGAAQASVDRDVELPRQRESEAR